MVNGSVSSASAAPVPRVLRRVADGVLRVPLVGKLIGANVVLIALVAWALAPATSAVSTRVVLVFVASLVVNGALVLAALRPLRALEITATRVAGGDLGARVPASRVADRDIARVGETFNALVDGLVAERGRLYRLAREVIHAGERQRAELGHALHDSAAQSLASLAWQASSMSHDGDTPATVRDRLASISDVATNVLEEVRSLAQHTYPRALDDLGLVVALRTLGHIFGQRDGVDVQIEAEPGGRLVPVEKARVLYRIAEEAIENAIRHGGARHVTVAVGTSAQSTWLVVRDDGAGFDVTNENRHPSGTGLFTMRERAALAAGTLDVQSSAAGTTVNATIPLCTDAGGFGAW